MNNRSIVYMTSLVILAILALLSFNLFSILAEPSAIETYVKYNEVRGIEVFYREKPYVLNFEQQKKMIALLNKMTKVSKDKTFELKPADFDKIVLYLFKQPNLTITPKGVEQNHLIFIVPTWHPDGFLQDISNGELSTLISETHS